MIRMTESAVHSREQYSKGISLDGWANRRKKRETGNEKTQGRMDRRWASGRWCQGMRNVEEPLETRPMRCQCSHLEMGSKASPVEADGIYVEKKGGQVDASLETARGAKLSEVQYDGGGLAGCVQAPGHVSMPSITVTELKPSVAEPPSGEQEHVGPLQQPAGMAS
jgi:hypothetical protein